MLRFFCCLVLLMNSIALAEDDEPVVAPSKTVKISTTFRDTKGVFVSNDTYLTLSRTYNQIYLFSRSDAFKPKMLLSAGAHQVDAKKPKPLTLQSQSHFSVSSNGKYLAYDNVQTPTTSYNSYALALWDLETLKLLVLPPPKDVYINRRCQFSADSRKLACMASSGFKIYDVTKTFETGQAVLSSEVTPKYSNSDYGQVLKVGAEPYLYNWKNPSGENTRIIRWDLTSKGEGGIFLLDTFVLPGQFSGLQLSHNEQKVYSYNWNRIYEHTIEGRGLLGFPAHKKGVRELVLSPDDTLLVSGGYEKDCFDGSVEEITLCQYTVKLWEAETGTPMKVLYRGIASKDKVDTLHFSPDSKTLIGGGTDVYLWDLR